jgi:hypothetical protein
MSIYYDKTGNIIEVGQYFIMGTDIFRIVDFEDAKKDWLGQDSDQVRRVAAQWLKSKYPEDLYYFSTRFITILSDEEVILALLKL